MLGRRPVGLEGIAAEDREEQLLGAAQEVPKPSGVRASAQGAFTAGLVRNGAGGTLTWKLTFRGLTGKATATTRWSARPNAVSRWSSWAAN